MKEFILNYLDLLKVGYIPGMKVRVEAWQSNSSSEHTAFLSQLPLPKRLSLDDYPTLKARTINNVLYVNSTSLSDYSGKKGFYFSEDHYTVIDKINYALNLSIYNCRYNDAIFCPRQFKFKTKRELEESKRLLIKFYTSATKSIRKILMKYFQFDDVIFPHDKIVKSIISVENPDPKEIYITLVHAGLLYPGNDEDFIVSDIFKSHHVNISDLVYVEDIETDSSGDMEYNILENEETLADFLLNRYSEVYPEYDGHSIYTHKNLVSHNVVNVGINDASVEISCNLLVKDCSKTGDEQFIPVNLSKGVSMMSDIIEEATELTRRMDAMDITVTNLKTNKKIVNYLLGDNNNIILFGTTCISFDPSINFPVFKINYTNDTADSCTVQGWTVQGWGRGKDDKGNYHYTSNSSVSTILSEDGNIMVTRFICKVDIQQLRDLLTELTSCRISSNLWGNQRKITPLDIQTLDGDELMTVFTGIIDKNVLYLCDVFEKLMILNPPDNISISTSNTNIFSKEEKYGVDVYWLNLTNLVPIMEKHPQVFDGIGPDKIRFLTVVKCLIKAMGDDWVNRLFNSTAVSIKYINI